jgi:aspartyl-tRNA(Asn)/glutamyl-tRNA(Gln) amidotransferase subunit B
MKGMIGLEIHTYLTTNEKLFCRCKASREKGVAANTFICPTCTGQPGAKPMLPNKEAVKKAVQIGLMLGCKINKDVKWQRKHYDWPDLPKGYQNTISGAHAEPLGVKGKFSGIKIGSMHLEEDPAAWDPKTGEIDYNRSGLPLVEIVTDPDFTDSEQVAEWLKKLVHALSYLKTVDKNAGIKADVNVSIPGKTERVEVKNVNSIDNVKKAIDFELERQAEEGSVRETRRFDEAKGKTFTMRSKEGAADYRFISDPDLQTIILEAKFISEIEKELPELPEEKLKKIIKKYSVDKKNAEVLTKYLDIAEFFEKVAEKIDGKFALPWVTIELLRVLNWNKTELDKVDMDVSHFVKLLEMVKSGKITELQAKQILNKFVPKSFDPSQTEGKITDEKKLKEIIERIVGNNNKAVEDYKKGDQKAMNFLMGEVMKATDRRADFKIARDILEKVLKDI